MKKDSKEEISDFLKFAYEHDRIRDVSEAFLEFPPEEEWHGGRVEYFIKEDNETYNDKYEIGDIVIVKEYK